MAFVTRSERRMAPKQVGTQENIGPGSYVQHEEYKKPLAYAPFQSTTTRDDEPTPSQLGPPPGHYNPQLPKGPYESGLPKKFIPFKSTEQRFAMSDREMGKDCLPGPGAYTIKGIADGKRPEDHRTMGTCPDPKSKSSYRALSAPSIPARAQSFGYEQANNGKLIRQRGPTDNISGRNDDCVGPDHYYVDERFTKKRITGGMMTITPRIPAARKSSAPGPGHYQEIEEKGAKRPGAAFQSRVMRGLKDTSKEVMPGPGQYDTLSAIKNKNQPHPENHYQFFGSTVERFSKKKSTGNPGPGSYATKIEMGSNGKKLKQTASRWKSSKQGAAPGPGQYETTEGFGIDPEKILNMNKSFSVLGNQGALAFGAMSTRFVKSARTERDPPGPGAYEAEPAGNDEVNCTRTQPSSFFKSRVPKDNTGAQIKITENDLPPPGTYDPRPVQETAEVVRIPQKNEGFLTAQNRFGGNRQKDVNVGPGQYNPGNHRAKNEFNRSMGMNRHGVPIGFATCTNRFHSQQKDGRPGPGDYEIEQSMVKKTYNSLFGAVI